MVIRRSSAWVSAMARCAGRPRCMAALVVATVKDPVGPYNRCGPGSSGLEVLDCAVSKSSMCCSTNRRASRQDFDRLELSPQGSG